MTPIPFDSRMSDADIAPDIAPQGASADKAAPSFLPLLHFPVQILEEIVSTDNLPDQEDVFRLTSACAAIKARLPLQRSRALCCLHIKHLSACVTSRVRGDWNKPAFGVLREVANLEKPYQILPFSAFAASEYAFRVDFMPHLLCAMKQLDVEDRIGPISIIARNVVNPSIVMALGREIVAFPSEQKIDLSTGLIHRLFRPGVLHWSVSNDWREYHDLIQKLDISEQSGPLQALARYVRYRSQSLDVIAHCGLLPTSAQRAAVLSEIFSSKYAKERPQEVVDDVYPAVRALPCEYQAPAITAFATAFPELDVDDKRATLLAMLDTIEGLAEADRIAPLIALSGGALKCLEMNARHDVFDRYLAIWIGMPVDLRGRAMPDVLRNALLMS